MISKERCTELLRKQRESYEELAEHDHKIIDQLTKELKGKEHEIKSLNIILFVFLIVALVGWVV